jgi:hypothetical protein
VEKKKKKKSDAPLMKIHLKAINCKAKEFVVNSHKPVRELTSMSSRRSVLLAIGLRQASPR